jgi:hypothetical protein
VLAQGFYSLDPGVTRTLRIAAGPRTFCADRSGRVLARVVSASPDAQSGGIAAKHGHALRLRGPGLRKARCT